MCPSPSNNRPEAGHAVVVRFAPLPNAVTAFRVEVLANAAASLRVEPDCLVFDVVETGDGEFWLYEIYRDRAGFEAHLRTEHFLSFSARVAAMVREKTVWQGAKLPPAAG